MATVPLCLRGRFSVTSAPTGNEHTTNITDIVPQRYSSPSGAVTYTGNDVQIGMYASTSSDGRIFRIKSVGTKTATSITGAILEDIEGLNKRFDSNGNQIGYPENGGGYIFQLNSEGLPMLTNISDPLSPQFTDSLMGRFLYDRNAIRHVGAYRSVQLFAQGTGQQASFPMKVVLNTVTVEGTDVSGDSAVRGLYLTILDGSNFSRVSVTRYNTAGQTNADAGDLATALNDMTRSQIGILTSYYYWETKIANGALVTAANRLGLTKLASAATTGLSGQDRPYAAIFYGGGTDTTVGTHDVIERMESNDGDAPLAIVSATLTTDGTFASIMGASSTNALYSADSRTVAPVVSVNTAGITQINGDLGVRTSNNLATLTIFRSGLQLSNINNNPITSQLAVTTDSQRLYIGSYYTGGTLACSALQASDYFSGRDNPTTLCLNPRGGQVNIGYGLAYTGNPTLDVNGTIRGKGSIVNTSRQSRSVGIWSAQGRSGQESGAVTLIEFTYTPVQSGTVNLNIYAEMVVSFEAGSGPDLVGWEFVRVDGSVITVLIDSRIRMWQNTPVMRGAYGDITRFPHTSFTSITGPTLFRLRINWYTDDTPFYRDAHIIVHELSQT